MLKESEQILRFFLYSTVLINGFTFMIKISIFMITSKEKIFSVQHNRSILARFEHDGTYSLDAVAVASKLGQVLLWKSEIDEASNLFQRCLQAYVFFYHLNHSTIKLLYTKDVIKHYFHVKYVSSIYLF